MAPQHDGMRTVFEPLPAARDEAAAAAARAALSLRPLDTNKEFAEASVLLAGIWGTRNDASPLSSDLLRSLSHADACVMGAVSAGNVVGAAVAISGAPASNAMYSLIAAVHPDFAGRGVGLALKYAQREWSLERGATRMLWTYDPLIRRNAYFNLVRLGARVKGYIPDFYPPMHDTLNRLDRTDRLCVDWNLMAKHSPTTMTDDGPVALAQRDGAPHQSRISPEPGTRVWIPRDIEALRAGDAGLAMRWRLAMAEVLQEAEAHRLVPVSVSPSGYYLLDEVDAL